jgi:hypothetical protein
MDEASDLCRSCGLCCNGILFDYVPVEEAEMGRLAKLGFAVGPGKDGAPRFDHPCPKFCGECTVYSERPESCRRYHCELLKKFEAGKVSFAEASRIVTEAKAMVAAVKRLFGRAPAPMLPMDWTRRFDKWRSTPPAQRSETESRLVLEETRLQRFLDVHFRSDDQRKALDKD